MTSEQNQPLRRAILANAAFSTLCGIALTAFPTWIAQNLGVSNPLILRLIGIGLLLFVVSLVHTATRAHISRVQIQAIIIQDLLWVVGSIILLMIRPFGLSTVGLWAIDIVAIMVAVFAYWQYRHLPQPNLDDSRHQKPKISS
ncbi:MAG: hypothetical protein AAFP77_03845 [Bacteroidota bacterium]